MKHNIRLFSAPSPLWSKLIELNPQVFREIQGKLITRNVVIAAAISVIAQFIAVVYLLGQLPELEVDMTYCGRYGMALIYQETGREICYAQNAAGNWVINWQLWWLDLFSILSIISIFTLLVVGSYLLITDLVKEEEKGTLNFIRLSPQSAGSVLLGKILGVPILVYTAIALLLPLHLIAGLQSHISLRLILAFDLTVVTSCAFFYSLALLWSLLNFGVSGFKSWIFSGLLGSLLLFSTAVMFDGGGQLDHFLAWALMFHPGLVLSYLMDAIHLPLGSINFLSMEDLGTLSFFGQAFWTKATIGISLIILNFSLWTYWCWSILKRRFHNPEHTILSKIHSYWLTAWFALIALGFTLQQDAPNFSGDISLNSTDLISRNFTVLQFCLSLFGLGLIFALSPQRQTLFDWARYRHHNNHNSLWKELVLGDNSPSTVAIALNLAIAIIFITPSIFLLLPPDKHYIFGGLLLSASNILLYAVIAQFILTSKTRKRVIWSMMTVASMIIIPPLCLGVAELSVATVPQVWLFGFMPIFAAERVSFGAIALAILGQWLAITVIGLQMTRKLNQAGASETKILISRNNVLID